LKGGWERTVSDPTVQKPKCKGDWKSGTWGKEVRGGRPSGSWTGKRT